MNRLSRLIRILSAWVVIASGCLLTACSLTVHPVSQDPPGSRSRSAAQTLVIERPITVHEFGEFIYPAGRYPIGYANSYGVFYEAPGGIQSRSSQQRVRGGFYSSYLDPGKIEAYDGGSDTVMYMHGCVPWAPYHLEH